MARPIHASGSDLLPWGKANGISELSLPRDVRMLGTPPALGTGKVDYHALNALAEM